MWQCAVFNVQAICIAGCYPEDWPLLVVCPSALRLQWADALLSWAPPDVLPPAEHIAIVAAAKVGTRKAHPSCEVTSVPHP